MLSALSGKDAKTAKTKNLRKVLKTLKQSKKFMKQTARVVCPGSLTERFIACGRSTTHSSLTAFERGLLASGPLSWRWLREEDEDLQAPSSVVVDEEGHRWALREMEMTSADAQRLRRMDSYLQEALWPACPARVSLAERLLSPKARRRRCERYLKEVIAPLLDETCPVHAWAAAMADQMPGAEESVLLHPKVICTGSEALCALSNYLITTSLGGLSGIKGTIPILMVAIGSRISDRCPLHLEDTWLESWVSIGMLSALLLLEILADCQVRSATESLVTGLLAFVVFLVGLVAAAVVLVVVILAVSHSAEESSKQALQQALGLITSCARAWIEATAKDATTEVTGKVVRRAWLHMLHRSIDEREDLMSRVCPLGRDSGPYQHRVHPPSQLGPRMKCQVKCMPLWRHFLPAVLVYSIWCYVMTKLDAWSEVSSYYVLSLAMVFGSLIAGSTPVGGGVVAFPLVVLYLKLPADQGRDLSLLVQAIGMSAASFLLIYAKRHLCHFWIILWFLISSLAGLMIGFELNISSRTASLLFTTTVSCFAIAYFYYLWRQGALTETREAIEPWELRTYHPSLPWLLTTLACLFGVLGGALTAKIGSGADIFTYIFGIVWNALVPKEAQISENMLTASSVVVMAGCSVFGVLLRLMTGEIAQEVRLCWAACVPVVVLGAPLGSLLLTPRLTEILRRLFYLFVLVQFVSMSILQLKDDWIGWSLVLVALVATALASHVVFHCK
eukprot:g17342.t2